MDQAVEAAFPADPPAHGGGMGQDGLAHRRGSARKRSLPPLPVNGGHSHRDHAVKAGEGGPCLVVNVRVVPVRGDRRHDGDQVRESK